MIKDTDTNIVHLSHWLYREFPDIFSGLLHILQKQHVAFEVIPNTNDLWCRDYMPVQIDNERFVCYTYCPDYLRKNKTRRKYITDAHEMCELLGLDAKHTDIIIDGGNVVKAGNRIIMTEKVFVENPQYTPKALQEELEKLFECELLFLPWDRTEKYGHSDGIVKEISNDTVLMTNYADFDSKLAAEMVKRLSHVFHVETLHYDNLKKDDRSWAYINFLSVGELIVLPQLGIDHDEQAYKQVCDYYPHHTVRELNVVESVANGGGLNCITWCRKGTVSIIEAVSHFTKTIMNEAEWNYYEKEKWLKYAQEIKGEIDKSGDRVEKKIVSEMVRAIGAAKYAPEAEKQFHLWNRELEKERIKTGKIKILLNPSSANKV